MQFAPRRTFLLRMAALSSLPVAARSLRSASTPRQRQALDLRQQAAQFQNRLPPPNARTNGDEASMPGFIGSFTKGLPHTALGEVVPSAFESLVSALAAGDQSAMEGIQRGAGAKLVDPLASLAFQMDGADSHALAMASPPAFSSPEAAGEMVELYWQALARDVPFNQYDSSPIIQSAIQDLNRLSAFHGPSSGKISSASVFRGNITGGLDGPFISQFFWQQVPLGSTYVPQLFREPLAGLDYLTTFDQWLSVQNGVPPARIWTPDPQPRYMHSGRSLAEWVHYDFLYQAFHNAALILLNQTPDTIFHPSPYLNPTNPYKSAKVQSGFATFGTPHICCLLGEVTQAALFAAWYQKWQVHRRTRPEEFGARVHQTSLGKAKYPIHSDLMNSAALAATSAATGGFMLPQAFPEGCPLHPSYPSGHATVSGACSVVLKAFFDENQVLPNPVIATNDGLALDPYHGPALTVGGEINKLAFNVAMGRNFAGIHYRSDAEGGIELGERVAIAMLEDLVNTYAEDFGGFRFTRVDGTPVTIVPAG